MKEAGLVFTQNVTEKDDRRQKQSLEHDRKAGHDSVMIPKTCICLKKKNY